MTHNVAMSTSISAPTVPTEISPSDAQRQALAREGVLLDVRTPAEYRAKHAEDAILLPLDELDPHAVTSEYRLSAQKPALLLCQSGKRASIAAEKFRKAGIEHVLVVTGGTNDWESHGLPIVAGQAVMSLERQVRIAAGTFVFVGTLLGVFVSPYWLILPGFVGAGLVFAGLTDTCGMGMLLAKMPWNR